MTAGSNFWGPSCECVCVRVVSYPTGRPRHRRLWSLAFSAPGPQSTRASFHKKTSPGESDWGLDNARAVESRTCRAPGSSAALPFLLISVTSHVRCSGMNTLSRLARRRWLNEVIWLWICHHIFPGGLACCLRVPVSDLLTHRPAVQRISESGASALDVRPASDHLLQVIKTQNV